MVVYFAKVSVSDLHSLSHSNWMLPCKSHGLFKMNKVLQMRHVHTLNVTWRSGHKNTQFACIAHKTNREIKTKSSLTPPSWKTQIFLKDCKIGSHLH